MTLLNTRHGQSLTLPGPPQAPEPVHCFDQREIDAVQAALAARRPLLVRGEPGVGKTQLARAVALDLKMAYVQQVIDIRTESRDLLWHFDAVGRLAEAQLRGALGGSQTLKALRRDLAVKHFLYPGPLWWAFDWGGASLRARALGRRAPALMPGCDPANGVVVLIDELDKAEPDVPNGLLEALGAGCFTPQGLTEPVVLKGPAPLVIITTNEERTLPDAFLRRCLVLVLALPEDETGLIEFLSARGRAHFPNADESVLREAARQVGIDRRAAQAAHQRPFPGQAEYLDLVRAVCELASTPDAQRDLLGTLKKYVLEKHGGLTA